MKPALLKPIPEDDDLQDDIDLSNQEIAIRIKAPTEYRSTVGIYYIVNGKEDEGGEFDADMFIEHIMEFYHKYY